MAGNCLPPGAQRASSARQLAEKKMLSQAEGFTKIILAALLFPVFFQDAFLAFALGSGDTLWILLAKRILLLLPISAIIFACWVTVPCVLSIIIRQERRVYVSSLLVTWWDLFRAIFSFWGGMLRFLLSLVGWTAGLLRLSFMAFWLMLQDVFLAPLRIAKDVGEDYFRPGVPWLAVMLTVFWSMIEAVLFTFVLTPLVVDILAGLSGASLSENLVQVPLFLMLAIVVLGSFAILASWGEAFKSRQIGKIIQIGIFEAFVFGFEVMFLYREFVDALVPWFAQHSSGEFRMGIIGILSISAFAWMGIRGVTWFLFASSGTPTIMAIIQRTGLQSTKGVSTVSLKASSSSFAYIKDGIKQIKSDMDWIREKGDEMLGAFILPPLQIIGATINFCTLLITGDHLFELPFKSFRSLLLAKDLIKKTKEKAGG
jgi:hypothetical protein